MINKLENIVINTYNKIYNKQLINKEIINEEVVDLIFDNEKIKADHSIGNKYRLWFDDYVGTIDLFRDTFDEILGFVAYCCDTSNFIDLTEDFVRKITEYYINN